jgi:hypothetical protein
VYVSVNQAKFANRQTKFPVLEAKSLTQAIGYAVEAMPSRPKIKEEA